MAAVLAACLSYKEPPGYFLISAISLLLSWMAGLFLAWSLCCLFISQLVSDYCAVLRTEA